MHYLFLILSSLPVVSHDLFCAWLIWVLTIVTVKFLCWHHDWIHILLCTPAFVQKLYLHWYSIMSTTAPATSKASGTLGHFASAGKFGAGLSICAHRFFVVRSQKESKLMRWKRREGNLAITQEPARKKSSVVQKNSTAIFPQLITTVSSRTEVQSLQFFRGFLWWTSPFHPAYLHPHEDELKLRVLEEIPLSQLSPHMHGIGVVIMPEWVDLYPTPCNQSH